ncbi:hypothetical protein HK104_000110 [Borealophlyctis nickersoniae]|nr:hypothetical protein HK104_000110 [Borealophlyctis nickersoniae]
MEQPGAMYNYNWEMKNETDRCLIDKEAWSEDCGQGNVVSYAVNASTAAHVIATVRFAAKHNIRLVVKGTGHDYIGRSTAPGGLSVWTYHMKGIEFDDDFVAKGCNTFSGNGKKTSVVTVGAGVRWAEVYAETNKRGKLVVGGFSPTVGASGGYVLGGGHSILSPTHGLAADNVVQFTLVTPTGKLVTASSCTNPDLFWALRGGGGGFGIILTTTHKTHPDTAGTLFSIVAVADTQPAYETYINKWVTLMPLLETHKFAGYFYQRDNIFVIPYVITPETNTTLLTSLLAPVLLPDSTPNVTITLKTNVTTPSIIPLFQSIAASIEEKTGPEAVLLGSRLIPSTLFKTFPQKITSSFLALQPAQANGTTVIWHLVASNAVAHPPKQNPSPAAVNPAWRKALLHVVYTQSLPPLSMMPITEALIAYLRNSVTQRTEILKQLAPDSGCYINESDAFEEGWEQSKYGANWDRLRKVKRMVDPERVMVCRQCVGWEEWEEVGEGTCKKV